MVKALENMVTGEQVVTWLIIFFLVAYFLYKEWPEFKKRISKSEVDTKAKEQSEKTVGERLESIETRLAGIEDKLARDYERMNRFDHDIRRNRSEIEEFIEENAIMMRAMLSVLKGLQELGTNGPTKDSQKELEDWLNEKAHRPTTD